MEPIYVTAASMRDDEFVREEWAAARAFGALGAVKLYDLFGGVDGPAALGDLINIVDSDTERELSVYADERTATIVATGGEPCSEWTFPAVKIWLDEVPR